MTSQLIAVGVLAFMAMVWLLVNIKAGSRALKLVSFVALWAFLIAASVLAVRLVLAVLA